MVVLGCNSMFMLTYSLFLNFQTNMCLSLYNLIITKGSYPDKMFESWRGVVDKPLVALSTISCSTWAPLVCRAPSPYNPNWDDKNTTSKSLITFQVLLFDGVLTGVGFNGGGGVQQFAKVSA